MLQYKVQRKISRAHLQRAIVLNYKCGYLLHSALHHYQLLCFMQRLRVTLSSAEHAEILC